MPKKHGTYTFTTVKPWLIFMREIPPLYHSIYPKYNINGICPKYNSNTMVYIQNSPNNTMVYT